jgi:catalase-peroxidase
MLKKTLPLIAALTLAFAPAVGTFAHAENHAAMAGAQAANTNQDWWPDKLDLTALRAHGVESNP